MWQAQFLLAGMGVNGPDAFLGSLLGGLFWPVQCLSWGVTVLCCFPVTMYFSLADVRSWKPVMPRSISGLVMQLMRVANVGGGAFGQR